MKLVVVQQDQLFGPWLAAKIDGQWAQDRGPTIGLLDVTKRQICAAAQFTDCNGASVLLHCAGEGQTWLNREFLWFCFFYPFEQLQVRKIISPVESWNTQCRVFIEHLGFTLEATLKDASPKGDLLLYTMTRDQCKWLSLREKYRGQAEGSSSA